LSDGTRNSSFLGWIVLKRGLDFTLAGFLLALSLPLLVAAAIAIKLDSNGPVLFSQERMGRGFKRFHLLKLRTMHKTVGGLLFTVAEDPRITRVGRWLRWFKVDEVPQLWNVLRGQMSLVGPRPVVPDLALEYRAAYERLLAVRPGLTDPATVKYCREDELLAHLPDPINYFKTVLVPEKLSLSASYLEHATLLKDIGLIARTALALFPFSGWPRLFPARRAPSAQASGMLFSEPSPRAEAQTSADNR
jgi:lipopolysaccharide/colanic/teichoic acid biosynthesis glycosyltransferase